MTGQDRSIAEIFQDIVRNLQEIVRSEIRLAKTELGEEAGKAKQSAMWLGAGAVTGLFAILFILLTVASALAIVVPQWAAVLIVGVVLTIAAFALLSVGKRQLSLLHPAPERTVETIKENVEWAKQQIK